MEAGYKPRAGEAETIGDDWGTISVIGWVAEASFIRCLSNPPTRFLAMVVALKLKIPFVVGLVGGVASGKTFASELLAEMGGVSINADALGHQVLSGPRIARQLRQLFGPAVLADDGSVDRGELSRLVFGSDSVSVAARRQLEEVVHPLIHAAAVQELRRYREAVSPPAMVVVDAPLLLEAGWAPMCDAIIFIETPDEIRLARARERGWNEQQWRDREAAQMPLEEKRKHATHIVASEPTPELRRKLGRIVDSIREGAS